MQIMPGIKTHHKEQTLAIASARYDLQARRPSCHTTNSEGTINKFGKHYFT